jgi:hypothetical protein
MMGEAIIETRMMIFLHTDYNVGRVNGSAAHG